MQHTPTVFVVAFVVLMASFSIAVTDAKRGCLKYGYSCLGGHGKRSSDMQSRHESAQIPAQSLDMQSIPSFSLADCKDEQLRDTPECNPRSASADANKFMRLNQEIAYPTSNQLGPNSKDMTQTILEERKMQIAVFNLVRQMINNARRTRELSSEARSDG